MLLNGWLLLWPTRLGRCRRRARSENGLQRCFRASAFVATKSSYDAAAATVLALEQEGPAIYNIVDDEPAPVREWLPVFAEALGAKPPRHFPTWLARLIAGEATVVMATTARGASNAKAKRELGWTLRYPSWRQGFPEVYAKTARTSVPRLPADVDLGRAA